MRPDRDTERELRSLGEKIDFPQTPDLARSVRRRIEVDETDPSHRRWLPSSPPQWAAVAAMLVLVLSIPVFSQAARDSLSGLFLPGGTVGGDAEQAAPRQSQEGARGPAGDPEITVAGSSGAESGGSPPSSGDAAGSPGGAGPIGRDLGFGEMISLRQARVQMGVRPLMPDLGTPDEVYALRPPVEGGVALVYAARPGLPALGGTGVGLMLVQLPGGEPALLEDTGNVARLERVEVGGESGYWAPDGLPASAGATGLPGASVLVWSEQDLALRLEADVTKLDAVRIADSVD